MEKRFAQFDANGKMLSVIAAHSAPGIDWKEVPPDWTGERPLKLIDGRVSEVSDAEIAAEKLTFEKHQAEMAVRQYAADVRAQLANHADQYRLAGWTEKARRAERVMLGTGTDSDLAILQAECNRRGQNESPEDLAKIQIAKANSLAHAVAIIDGMEAFAIAHIETAESEADLDKLLSDLKVQAQKALSELSAG